MHYRTMHWFLIILSIFALVIGIALNIYDESKDGKHVMNAVIKLEVKDNKSEGHYSFDSEFNFSDLFEKEAVEEKKESPKNWAALRYEQLMKEEDSKKEVTVKTNPDELRGKFLQKKR
jgi:hypothetical protein